MQTVKNSITSTVICMTYTLTGNNTRPAAYFKVKKEAIKKLQTPQSSTENLRVEFLLVLADLRGVALRSNVGWVHVHHRALPVVLSLDLLTLTAGCTTKQKNNVNNARRS